ncbi:MAG: hypothetical protein BGO67_08895 [Alphaproteobacteria bacterium 41-28]|nr:MAG: hypothetical protein BGO67_08895 [Alphaproteobacteria bacterium 41-28]
MKLKFLYLLLATGFLFLETNGRVQGASLSVLSTLCTQVHKLLSEMPAECSTVCNNTTSIPNPIDVGKCASALSKSGNVVIQDALAVACDAACTGSHFGIAGTCSNPTILSQCAQICCNIPAAASKVTN